jgi:ectoine hydroxylase-related dioxygenase (phytanoyl-CoA dioxygenase family)
MRRRRRCLASWLYACTSTIRERTTGTLRVLPGTHTLGVLTEADTERLVREIPAVDCLVPSGGIVAMRPLIVHASSKAETNHPRRVLHIEYVDWLEVEEGLRIAIA